jgi:hypothetical protein
MRTFFALRHMGSVEWVTDQVPWSHSRGGAVKDVEDGSLGLYLIGERRDIGVLIVGGTSTMIVVPPGDSPGARLEVAMGLGSVILAESRDFDCIRSCSREVCR